MFRSNVWRDKEPSGALGELEVKGHSALTNHLPALRPEKSGEGLSHTWNSDAACLKWAGLEGHRVQNVPTRLATYLPQDIRVWSHIKNKHNGIPAMNAGHEGMNECPVFLPSLNCWTYQVFPRADSRVHSKSQLSLLQKHMKEAKGPIGGQTQSHILSPHKKRHIPAKAMFRKINETERVYLLLEDRNPDSCYLIGSVVRLGNGQQVGDDNTVILSSQKIKQHGDRKSRVRSADFGD